MELEAIEAVLPSELPLDYVERVTGLKLDAAVARLERRGVAVAANRGAATATWKTKTPCSTRERAPSGLRASGVDDRPRHAKTPDPVTPKRLTASRQFA